jgi:hypothetical protein
VRPVDVTERNRLNHARTRGAFVAWRDERGALQVQSLLAEIPVTIGRGPGNDVALANRLLSREHALLVMRVRGVPSETSIFVSDRSSKYGSQWRPSGVAPREAGPDRGLKPVPTARFQLPHGDHDLALAGEVWLLVGAVPFDVGGTGERESGVESPVGRPFEVLRELCRPQFEAGASRASPPSNAQIGLTLGVQDTWVSDNLTKLYNTYGIEGTHAQRRHRMVDYALEQRLITAADYL